MTKEQWIPLEDYPPYAISDHGRIMNAETSLLKVGTQNKEGVLHVGMYVNGRQVRRSLALLIARHFLPEPELPSYDTPIHLNGDRRDCSADNLAWRQRWFAVAYHRQFNDKPRIVEKIRINETDQVFENSMELAQAYGLLDSDVAAVFVNNALDNGTEHSTMFYNFTLSFA